MGPLDFLNHLLNFVAPAAWLALGVTLVARIFIKNRPVALTLPAQAAINFVVAVMVLGIGLWVFGRDGKMLTYTGMALLSATSQWVMLRGWR
ncbi:MAG: hypothetical protein WCG50_18695 [Rhodoferax sp.]|uniref:hypothetical protein n=1 Tax=Rhodoferax sp. TaxID=50421 RepID=UPI00301778DC